jgi:hypothetical protein
MLGQRQIYIVAVAVIGACLAFYVLREIMAPGFFARTAKVDYGRFLTSSMSWHHHPWYYYFWNWQRLGFFTPYVYWLPIALTVGLVSKKYRVPSMLLIVQVLAFVGILSYPVVKLMWYDAPAYPLLALLCAIGFVCAWDFLLSKVNMSMGLKNALFVVCLGILFFFPVKAMYQRNVDNRLPVDILEREGHFIRELHRTKSALKNYKVLMVYDQNAHYTQVDFYMNAYNRYEGYGIELLRDTSMVASGDTIAVCQENLIAWLKEKYVTEVLSKGETGCELLVIGQ